MITPLYNLDCLWFWMVTPLFNLDSLWFWIITPLFNLGSLWFWPCHLPLSEFGSCPCFVISFKCLPIFFKNFQEYFLYKFHVKWHFVYSCHFYVISKFCSDTFYISFIQNGTSFTTLSLFVMSFKCLPIFFIISQGYF